jgi:peptide/nickel transport system substrate-binding protein
VLQGVGVGALGLAGAALLGCGGGGPGGEGGQVAPGAQGGVQGASSGGGLPKVAPVVQGKPRYGGSWTTTFTSEPQQFDAHTARGPNIFHYGVSERVLEPHPDTGEIRPHVATSWEVADPNGLTLILKIHPKLFVHNIAPYNGRQFTATDVAWNLERVGALYAERLKIPKASFQRATMVQNITKAEAVDPLTVKVTLSKPNSAFFNGIMENRTPLMPKEVDDIGFKDPLKLGGIGAYYPTEWVNEQRHTFKKNPRYAEFRAGEPYFDENVQIAVPDTAATTAAFLSGQTQSVAVATPDAIEIVRRTKPDSNLYAWVDGNWDYFRPSLDYEPFKDFRVRKAFSLAIDYKDINDGYYGPGWAYQAALSPGFPEGWKPDKVQTTPGYNPQTKEQDRTEAQKMLAAAGFPNGKGLEFDVLFQRSDYVISHTTRLQGQLKNVFPDMKLTQKSVESAVFSVDLAEGDFVLTGYTNTVVPDAVLEMTSQYHSTGSRNYGHGNFPAIDALLDKAIVELNKDARTKMLDEFQRRFIDEWMLSFVLNARPVRRMLAPDIGGFDKWAGYWMQYSGNAQVGRWYFVEK